ncbi:hypothetical protein JNK13_10365 [bacterium]|nr:hypothetical protein [bacterium]
MDVRYLLVCLIILTSCTSSTSRPIEIKEQSYPYAFRQLPPEPVYNRLRWSQTPQPTEGYAEHKDSPYLRPVIAADLKKSSLSEAVEAIAQTLGYRAFYPNDIAKRRVSIRQDGSIEMITSEIEKQANVSIELSHNDKIVRVVDREITPQLPPAAK